MSDQKEPWLGKTSDKDKSDKADKAKDASDKDLKAKKDDDLDLDILIPEKPVADGDSDGAGRTRPRLLPMWLLIAATAVAALAWAISDRMSGTEEAYNANEPVPYVTAEDEPIKIKPDDPGGLDVPNRDKYVYKSLGEEEPENEAEQLLPPPEEPLERPTPPDEMETAADSSSTPSPSDLGVMSVEPASGTSGDMTHETPVAALDTEGAAGADQSASMTASVVTPAPPKPMRQAAVEKTTTQATTQAAAQPTTNGASAPTGRFLIQIASTQEETAIEREWRRLLVHHSEVLGEKQKYVKRADLGEKGIWYRLQVGPFAERDDASAACETLKASRVGCFVVRN